MIEVKINDKMINDSNFLVDVESNAVEMPGVYNGAYITYNQPATLIIKEAKPLPMFNENKMFIGLGLIAGILIGLFISMFIKEKGE